MDDTTQTTGEQRLRAVKFVEGSDSLIEGLAIPFGGPIAGKDLDGEDFGPDTDFAFDLYPQGRPVIYHHGLDAAMKTAVQGRQITHEVRDEGVWAQVQLDKSAKYHATVARMISGGKMFFSSGSIPHLVEVEADGHIKSWPWTELSLTPTPSNPWAATAFKSADLMDHMVEAGIAPSAELIALALKALDQSDPEAVTVPSPLEAKAGRVSVAVAEFRDHALESVEMRAKAGRVLSTANRERIAAALASREAVLSAYADLEALLAETDSKAIDTAFLHDVAHTLARAALVDIE